MKEIKLLVPEDKAQVLAEDVLALLKKHDIESDNQEAINCLLPVTERIKTFEDALRAVGIQDSVEDWESAYSELSEDVVAYIKLTIITQALNEGWKPQFTEDEYRWFPYFRYYSAEEIADMTDSRRKSLGLVGAYAHNGAQSGLGFVYSSLAWSIAYTIYGSRLAYKTEELADYSGHQFKDIWEVYVGKF